MAMNLVNKSSQFCCDLASIPVGKSCGMIKSRSRENAATNKPVVHAVESSEKMGNLSDQVTLQKTVAAANLDPGVYRSQIKVSDNISKQSIDPTATFAVQ